MKKILFTVVASLCAIVTAKAASADPEIIATQLCIGSVTQFAISPSVPGSDVLWNFGDGQTASGPSQQHLYPLAGNYNVSATIVTSATTIVKRKMITISVTPVIGAAVNNRSICTTGDVQYQLAQHDATLLGTQSASLFGVAFFTSPENLVAHINPVTTLGYGIFTIYAKVYNRVNPGCYARTTFQIGIFRSPQIGAPANMILTDSNSDGTEIFDLSQQSASILAGQSALDYRVTYHLNHEDATLGQNAISQHYNNIQNPQLIYCRIENRLNRSCCRTSSFELRLIKNSESVMRN